MTTAQKELVDGSTIGEDDLLTLEISGEPVCEYDEEGRLYFESIKKEDAFIIRSTNPLPKLYKVSVEVGDINFDLLDVKDEENGMYFVAITDLPGEPTSNDWWHLHRTVFIDTDNNVWHPEDYHPIYIGYYVETETYEFYNGKTNSWGRKWKPSMNYLSDKWYTFEIEKNQVNYVYRIFENSTNQLLKETSIPIDKVLNSGNEEYLAVGEPHINYYTGNVKIGTIVIEDLEKTN